MSKVKNSSRGGRDARVTGRACPAPESEGHSRGSWCRRTVWRDDWGGARFEFDLGRGGGEAFGFGGETLWQHTSPTLSRHG
jgi:hypothetical protein